METFLEQPIPVPFASIYLDPNNPRLGLDDAPGYEDPVPLFDPDLQVTTEQALNRVYDVDSLVTAITGQGWMPIDNIVVWTHPDRQDAHIVVEGNTRTLALRQIRGPILERETKKLSRMEEGKTTGYAEHDIKAQQDLVRRLNQIVVDTEKLAVVPLAARTVGELRRKLPRVLAVRHITGAKEWGNYAEDLWLLQRYQNLFEERHPKRKSLFWDPELIKWVADEASLKSQDAKRKLRAASAFSHFKAEYEDRLPDDDTFSRQDYYLFENIAKKPFLRDQLGFGEDELHLSSTGEEVIFEWIFKHPRPTRAEDNENVFYRHENVLVWDQMKRYDEKHGTGFASRFDVSDYKNVPTMREVEAEWSSHKARKKPQAVIEDLLRRLEELPASALISEGEFLRAQLNRLHEVTGRYIRLMNSAA
jgi:hypothetical protein